MADFSTRLRELLKRRNMYQWQLADRIYVSQNTVSNYVTGLYEPSIGTLCRMADIFGVSVDYLVGRTN